MVGFPTLRNAAIRATPAVLDAERWEEKAERLLHQAADPGARLAVLPEYFIPLAFPTDFPVDLPAGREVSGRGGAAVVEPTWGEVIAGPLYGEEGIAIAECGRRRGLHARRWFASVGHCSREDVRAGERPDEGEPVE